MSVDDPRQVVLDDLAHRPVGDRARVPRRSRVGVPRGLRAPDLQSVRFLKERGIPGRRLFAVTVDDDLGDRWFALACLEQDPQGGWRQHGGVEGPDRPVVGREEPWLNLGAVWDAEHFFAGGQIQGAAADIAVVRLVWPDGFTLEDDAASGAALFLAARVPQGPARAEFYNAAGVLIASHETLKDETEPIRLPNLALAEISADTLIRFALSTDHALGRHKARLFESELGISPSDWARLRDRILEALPGAVVRSTTYATAMGVAYAVPVTVTGLNGASIPVLTIWTVLEGQRAPRLRSASVEVP
jgi:hypothetical protein